MALDQPEINVRRWLRGIVSRHSPTRPPPASAQDGQPLVLGAGAWFEEAAPTAPTLETTLDTLSDPWARQSIEGWYRAHNEGEEQSRAAQHTISSLQDAPAAPPPLPQMDEERFLTFGKQATSMSEVDLLDLLDLFDRDSVGEVGFEEFVVVIGFLLAIETRAFALLLAQHIPTLHEMLSRPGCPGPTPSAAIQLCTLAGLDGRTVEQELATLQLSIAEPIESPADFGRLLFATLGAVKPDGAGGAAPLPGAKATAKKGGDGRSGYEVGTEMGEIAPLARPRRGSAGRSGGGLCGACGCGRRSSRSAYAA